MKLLTLLAVFAACYFTAATAWRPGKYLLNKIKKEIDSGISHAKTSLETNRQNVEKSVVDFNNKSSYLLEKHTKPKLEQIVKKANEEYRESERKAISLNIPIEACKDKMTALYMGTNEIIVKVEACVKIFAPPQGIEFNKTMESYRNSIKQLDALQTLADACVSNAETVLEVAEALLCIKPLPVKVYLATRRAENVGKELKREAKEQIYMNSKISTCSEQSAISELSKNNIGQEVKECIELKIQQHDLSTTTASAGSI